MNEINEDLIYKQFEEYSYDIMNRTFNKLLKRKEKDEKKASKVREEKFNEAIKELLEICPQVSMIPVGESYQYGEECYDTNDFDRIYESTYYNLSDKAVPKQYDERLEEKDFVMAEGAIGRAHYITTGDEYTLAKDLVANVTAIGEEVELAANGKLAKKTNGTAIGEVVRIYKWNGQDSVMIRFY